MNGVELTAYLLMRNNW